MVGGDAGYTCERYYYDTELLNESVTTTDTGNGVAMGTLSGSVTGYDTIKVIFDGTEYECEIDSMGSYGASESPFGVDFSEYPFAIHNNNIATETAGTFSVVVIGGHIDVSTDICFRKAVGQMFDCNEVTVPTIRTVHLRNTNAVTIPAHSEQTLSFSGITNGSEALSIVSIMGIPEGLVIHEFYPTTNNGYAVTLYNTTDSSKTIASGVADLTLAIFKSQGYSIATCGTSGGGDDPIQ